MRLSNLLYSTYWFSQPDPADGQTEIWWLVVLIGFLAVGAVALTLRRRLTDHVAALFARRLGNCLATLGIVGLLFFLLRQERVAFLGWRVWFLLWAAAGGVWAGRLAYFWFKRAQAIRAEEKERAAREEFLPGRSK